MLNVQGEVAFVILLLLHIINIDSIIVHVSPCF